MKLDSTEARSSDLTLRHAPSSFPLVGLDPGCVASTIAKWEFATGYVVLGCAHCQELTFERVDFARSRCLAYGLVRFLRICRQCTQIILFTFLQYTHSSAGATRSDRKPK